MAAEANCGKINKKTSCNNVYRLFDEKDQKDELKKDELKKRAYLEKDGRYCPHCKEEDIDYGSLEFDGDSGWQTCSCFNCQRTWQNYYELKLISVEFADRSQE